jgi:hypothetical protein
MADTLGVARRQVTVVRGTTAANEVDRDRGLTAADVEARVNRALHSNEEHDGD